MFVPFKYYLKKKSADNENTDLKEAKQAWSHLSNKKVLKYIKKAERAYDKYCDENERAHVEGEGGGEEEEEDKEEKCKNDTIEPFYESLSCSELALLIQSYGLPNKLPVNTMLYFIEKCLKANKNKENMAEQTLTPEESESVHSDDLTPGNKTYKELEDKWKKMTEAEKSKYHQEYQQAELENKRAFLRFARQLPERRVVDYEHYLMKPLKKRKSPNESTSSPNKRAKNTDETKSKEFNPAQIYYEKNKSDFSQYNSEYVALNKARSAYSALSDEDRIEYIREAEQRYDDHQFKSDPKPLLSSFMKKDDLKTLLKLSYKMPERVNNILAEYVKDKFKNEQIDDDVKPNDRFKLVIESYKNLSDDDKKSLIEKHKKALEKYEQKLVKFLAKLPEKRKADFEEMVGKRKAMPKKASNSASANTDENVNKKQKGSKKIKIEKI